MRILIAWLFGAAALGMFNPAMASTIQLAHGEELTAIFSIPGYSSDSPSNIPATISLELAGSTAPGSATAPIPGSSQNYYSGILLSGSVQSTNGQVSIPLFDADAWRLSLATGNMVAEANYGGGAIVYAQAALSTSLAESLFGLNGQVEFIIQNEGADLTIGLGPGYSLSNAILAPLSAGNGAINTSGVLLSAQVSSIPVVSTQLTASAQQAGVPEPGTISIAVGGGALLFWLRRKLRPTLE